MQRSSRSSFLALLRITGFALLLTLVALPAQAADRGITLGLLGGVGGPADGGAFDGSGVQFYASYDYSRRQHLVLRVGELDLDDGLDNSLLRDGELTYVTLGTSFRLDGNFYESGLTIGIGAYRQESFRGLFEDDGFGVNIGVDGRFEITEHWIVMVELTGHWADLDTENLWVTALGGIGFSF